MDLNECYAFYGSAMNKLVHVILYDVLSKEFELFLGMILSPDFKNKNRYCKVTSSNTSRLEAHAAFFKLLMKGFFDPYVLLPFDRKLIS